MCGLYVEWTLRTRNVLPVAHADRPLPAPPEGDGRSRWAEGVVTAELLAGLSAFPDADVDVLLDLRDRLRPARRRFTSLVAEIAAQSQDNEAETVAAEARRALGDAADEIDQRLDDLGAKATLLRVAGNPASSATVGSGLALATTGFDGLPTIVGLLHAIVGAGVVTVAANEALKRRELRQEIRSSPIWILYDAERKARRRLSR
jgi:hypothetical protein